jgi:hypothetical protein
MTNEPMEPDLQNLAWAYIIHETTHYVLNILFQAKSLEHGDDANV